jgi:hypothetical protein
MLFISLQESISSKLQTLIRGLLHAVSASETLKPARLHSMRLHLLLGLPYQGLQHALRPIHNPSLILQRHQTRQLLKMASMHPGRRPLQRLPSNQPSQQ